MGKAEDRLIKRQNKKKRKLEEAGIKYDFDAVAYVSGDNLGSWILSHSFDGFARQRRLRLT